MPSPGANISYHNTSFLWECFFRKLGFKPKTFGTKGKTALYNTANDDGTTFPRQVGLCAKYSATTAPQSNTAADAPSGKGDICIYFAAEPSGSSRVPVASISIYRCSAYTNSTAFTWTLVL